MTVEFQTSNFELVSFSIQTRPKDLEKFLKYVCVRVFVHIMYLLCPVLHGHPKVKISRVSRASGR